MILGSISQLSVKLRFHIIHEQVPPTESGCHRPVERSGSRAQDLEAVTV